MTRYLLSLKWRKSPGRFPRDPIPCPRTLQDPLPRAALSQETERLFPCCALPRGRFARNAARPALCAGKRTLSHARVSSSCLGHRGGATQDSVAPASTARPGPAPPGRGMPAMPGRIAETGAHCPSDAADAQSCLRAAARRRAVAASRLPPRRDGIPARRVTQPVLCQRLTGSEPRRRRPTVTYVR